jgi:hypothetical protein
VSYQSSPEFLLIPVNVRIARTGLTQGETEIELFDGELNFVASGHDVLLNIVWTLLSSISETRGPSRDSAPQLRESCELRESNHQYSDAYSRDSHESHTPDPAVGQVFV